MGLDSPSDLIKSYPDLIEEINKFLALESGSELVYLQLVLTVKWKFDYIIAKKLKMAKPTNSYVPKYVPENLPWFERDGLMTWYHQGKCSDFLRDANQQAVGQNLLNST